MITGQVDPVARALAAAAQVDATQALADAATAQVDATTALTRAPFAGAVFSVTAGVLTVHSSYGITSMVRGGMGQYSVVLDAPPANYAAAINQARSASFTDSGSQYQKDTEQVVTIENGVPTDVGAAALPSSVVFFEV